MEVIHPSVRPGQRSCPSCGEALEGRPRFCPSCGTEVRPPAVLPGPQTRWEPQSVVGDSPAVSKSSPGPGGKTWSVTIPVIATGLIIVLLAGSIVVLNGKVGIAQSSLAAARARVASLNRKVSSLDSRLETMKDEKSKLETQNSSLTSAMVDCKAAASKTRAVFRVAYQLSQGKATASDYRTAAREANRAWSVCSTEASTNGAL
jgi:hypothetical protein